MPVADVAGHCVGGAPRLVYVRGKPLHSSLQEISLQVPPPRSLSPYLSGRAVPGSSGATGRGVPRGEPPVRPSTAPLALPLTAVC